MNLCGLCVAGLMIIAGLVAVPGALADHDGENPTFDVPDPGPVTGGAEATAMQTAGTATTTHQENEQEVNDAVGTVGDSAENGDPEVPAQNVDNVVENTEGFANASVEGFRGYGSIAQDWAFGEANGKLAEINETGDRLSASATHHITASRTLAQTALGALCRDTVIGEGCDGDSLVGQLTNNSEESSGQAQSMVANQQSNAQAVTGHVMAEIQMILCGGSCEP